MTQLEQIVARLEATRDYRLSPARHYISIEDAIAIVRDVLGKEGSQPIPHPLASVRVALEAWRKAGLNGYGEFVPADHTEAGLLKALTQLDAWMAEAGWRTIDTAPRDGSLVYVYSPTSDWNDEPGRCDPASYQETGSSSIRGKCMKSYRWVWKHDAMVCCPTHWMPLPPPPNPQPNKKDEDNGN